MKFAYEDLSDDQFEKLVVFLCQRLLGISVQGFAKGPDGGRDAKFVGTAELHPSKAAPWVGTIIVQAKHTNGYNRNFWLSFISGGTPHSPPQPWSGPCFLQRTAWQVSELASNQERHGDEVISGAIATRLGLGCLQQ